MPPKNRKPLNPKHTSRKKEHRGGDVPFPKTKNYAPLGDLPPGTVRGQSKYSWDKSKEEKKICVIM